MLYLMEIFLLLFITISDTISCGTEIVGTNQSATNGDKLAVTFYLDKQHTTMCPHGYCDAKELALIESKIASKFGSNSFSLTVTLSNGNVTTITAMFCSYGKGKRLNQ
jgi:hypothetical protein